MLSDRDVERIAKAVVRLMRGDSEWVTSAEAARLAGVSEQTIRKNRQHYRHTKRGTEKQGRLLFERAGIEMFYINS